MTEQGLENIYKDNEEYGPVSYTNVLEIHRKSITLGSNGKEEKIEKGALEVLLNEYLEKFKGIPDKKAPNRNSVLHVFAASLLAFIGLLLVSITDSYFLKVKFTINDNPFGMLTGAYAATSVLLYDAYASPLAQPRNAIGSYIISSFVGVTTRIICGYIGIPLFIVGPIAVGVAIIAMNITNTVHPPGGACALISVIGGPVIHDLGYGYVLTSFGASFIMFTVALIGNNLFPDRRYPQYWY